MRMSSTTNNQQVVVTATNYNYSDGLDYNNC